MIGLARIRSVSLSLSIVILTVSQIGCFCKAFSFSRSQPRGLSHDEIFKLARKRFQGNEESNGIQLPMNGRVAVITGAAGGIGGELSKVVHRLGGTVVALDRNATGLEILRNNLIDDHDDGKESATSDASDKILILPTNHEDLDSVKKSSEIIESRFDKVDLLVNNAGLTYRENPMISTHGKDLAFTVNYLSHFLLTERLLERLSKGGRIVHLTSTFHWMVDGSELLPDATIGSPVAYQSDPRLQSSKHVERSYANTKLAQIWHSRSIAKSLPDGAICNSVCVCPTWASTGIAGDDARSFLETYAFPVSDCGPGVTSAINGMLRTDEELGDALDDGKSFVANSKIIDHISFVVRGLLTSKLVKALGWRDFLANILSAVLLFGQKFTYKKFIIQETSPESFEDAEKRVQFYEWSKMEVQPWLKQKSSNSDKRKSGDISTLQK